MAKGSTFKNDLLALVFNATAISGLARDAAVPIVNIFAALHTGDPTAGTQTTNEAAYTSYARVAIARTTSGFPAPSGGVVSPAANITFPAATGGSETETYASFGSSVYPAVGEIFYVGTVTPNIVVVNGTTPQLTTASTVTEV